MGNITFCSPTRDEFKLVEKIFLDVWEQPLLKEVFIKHINSDKYSIICAYIDAEIVGVVSSFLSISNKKERRWEVDLIAVKRKYQGLGIGKGLVYETLKKALELNVDFARALVRTDNTASQTIFKKSGFKTDNIRYHLQLWKPENIGNKLLQIPNVMYLLMNTLSYRGLWIENLFDKSMSQSEVEQAIYYAQHKAFMENRDNTGALICENDINKLPEHIFNLSRCNGKYNWWTYCFI